MLDSKVEVPFTLNKSGDRRAVRAWSYCELSSTADSSSNKFKPVISTGMQGGTVRDGYVNIKVDMFNLNVKFTIYGMNDDHRDSSKLKIGRTSSGTFSWSNNEKV